MANQRPNNTQNAKRQGQGRQAQKRPAPNAKGKQQPAKKKKVSSSRAHSTAAVLGALFSIIFVGAVVLMVFKIKLAVHDRDRQNSSEAEVYKAPASAVTEVSSAAAVTSAQPAETTVTTTADPLVVLPPDTSSGAEGKPAAEIKKKPAANSINDLSGLRNDLNSLVEGFGGKWQIYVRHMDSGTELSIDSGELYSAGLIDLFAASSAYQQVTDGKLDAAYTDDLVRAMIAMNDIGSLEELSQQQGLTAATDWCRQQGFWDTELRYETSGGNTSSSDTSSESTADNGENAEGQNNDIPVQPVVSVSKNTTSVRDTGRLLTALYKGEIVNKDYCDKIIGFMQAQQDRNKLPAGLPEDTKCVNKAGTSDDAAADAAIVYCDTGDYVIAVMGDTPGFGWTADDYFAQISETVYNYFNGDPDASSETDEDTDDEDTDEDEDDTDGEDYTEPTGITE